MDSDTLPVPSHIPPSLVYDFDYFLAPELTYRPHQRATALLHKNAPEIFWTPRNNGHWIVTRATVAQEMLRQTDLFSSRSEFNKERNFDPPMLPIQADPPDHTEYRKILNPFLTPGAVAKMEADIRALARQIIDDIQPNGRCDFVKEVGQRFPITIFLRLVNAPYEDRHRLIKCAEGYTRSALFEDRLAHVRQLGAYIRELFEERRKNLGTDMLSHIIRSSIFDRPLNQREEEGLATLLFLGGLDTVKSALSFTMLYLARNPDKYNQLRDNPALIRPAIEEILRTNGVSVPERGATGDFDYNGVPFRRGDRIVFMVQLYGYGDQINSNPELVDFTRDISLHYAFGAGPHRCVGSHLARLEFRIFLEEWISRFPSFRVDQEGEIATAGGIVWAPDALPLAWDV